MELRHWVFLGIVLLIGYWLGMKYPGKVPFLGGTPVPAAG